LQIYNIILKLGIRCTGF